MIYISTGGQRFCKATQYANLLYDVGIKRVELSGGLYSEDVVEEIKKFPKDFLFQIHNYFPPPKDPFVFNLASLDSTIYEKSIAHAVGSIKLAAKFGLGQYSFHAGFRVNPKVQDLGGQLGGHRLASRPESLAKFQMAVSFLSNVAMENGVDILVENNVINQKNYHYYGEDPLLLTSPNEIIEFLKTMPSNVGILLDVAHLNVSAKTLEYSREEAHEQLRPFIRAYHLSENDGTKDSNEPINENSWFWKYIKPSVQYISLEVYGCDENMLFEQYQLAQKKLKP